MRIAKKLIHPGRATELVPAGKIIQISAHFPNSCRVTQIRRHDGEPLTPFIVKNTTGFISNKRKDEDQIFRIEALTDVPVYYLISDEVQDLLVVESSTPAIGQSR